MDKEKSFEEKTLNRDILIKRRHIIEIFLKLLILTGVFSWSLVNSGMVLSDEKTDILTVGEGVIIENNIADARKEAISDAQKKGMEEYLSLYLGPQGMTSYFPVLINDIIPLSSEEIENYHILAEDTYGEKYSILMRVKINEKRIDQRLRDMGIVSVEDTSIKVLFLVVQEKGAGEEISFWWNDPDSSTSLTTTELKLYNHFQELGLNPVNRLSGTPGEEYSEDMMNLELSDEDALKWGKIFSADVIIKGKSSVTNNNTVLVDLEAIKVENGRLICRASQEEQMNPDEIGDARFIDALEAAVDNVAIQFGPEIITAFRKNSEESNNIRITLKDISSFEEFRLFKNFLELDVGNIKSITQSRIQTRSMSLMVEFFGTKDLFISKLKNNKDLPLQAGITVSGEGDLVIKIEHEMIDPMDDYGIDIY